MDNKRVLVCGASQGIGQAVAEKMAQKGWQVTLLARSEERLKEIINQLPGQGHDILACDLSEAGELQDLLQEKVSETPYGALVLNSGGPKGGPISQAEPEEFLKGMQTHLVANSLLVRSLLEPMKALGSGRIVTVTSTSVKVPIPHLGVSNTVRAAVASWAKTLSLELAPFGITVNNVMPGFTETPRLQSLMEARAKADGVSPRQVEESWKNLVPMKRFAKPEETAALIDFLCSHEAGYITGQNIAVDGGRLGCL